MRPYTERWAFDPYRFASVLLKGLKGALDYLMQVGSVPILVCQDVVGTGKCKYARRYRSRGLLLRLLSSERLGYG